MSEETWPSPTPRDEVLARVVARGRRIQMINRLMIAAAVATAATVAGVGVWLGASGAVDLVGDDGAAPAVVAPPGDDGASSAAGGVAYFACPNVRELGELRGGDRVYLTGRDDSGEWVELRSPVDAGVAVWVRAEVVDPDGDADLPEVDCEITEMALGAPTTTPEELPAETTTTTTQAEDEPTTSTTRPTQPTTPPTQPTTPTSTQITTPPDTTPPVISSLARTNPVIRTSGEFCAPGIPQSTVVSATVSDASGVATVHARWSFTFAGETRSGEALMTGAGGNTYATTLSFMEFSGAQTLVNINWSVRAVDVHGNARTVTSGPNNAVELQGC